MLKIYCLLFTYPRAVYTVYKQMPQPVFSFVLYVTTWSTPTTDSLLSLISVLITKTTDYTPCLSWYEGNSMLSQSTNVYQSTSLPMSTSLPVYQYLTVYRSTNVYQSTSLRLPVYQSTNVYQSNSLPMSTSLPVYQYTSLPIYQWLPVIQQLSL